MGTRAVRRRADRRAEWWAAGVLGVMVTVAVGTVAAAPKEGAAMAGTSRRVVGTAVTTKLGAAVQPGDGDPWWVSGWSDWPPGVAGRTVVVEGEPAASAQPEATRDATGAWTQGVEGGSPPARSLRQARWHLADPAAGPWTLSISDGSANTTEIRFDGERAQWSYRPVTPARSSTGMYSGGEPASGVMGAAEARAFWVAVASSVLGLAESDGARAKGTGLVTSGAPDVTRQWVVPPGPALSTLLARVAAIRGGTAAPGAAPVAPPGSGR